MLLRRALLTPCAAAARRPCVRSPLAIAAPALALYQFQHLSFQEGLYVRALVANPTHPSPTLLTLRSSPAHAQVRALVAEVATHKEITGKSTIPTRHRPCSWLQRALRAARSDALFGKARSSARKAAEERVDAARHSLNSAKRARQAAEDKWYAS